MFGKTSRNNTFFSKKNSITNIIKIDFEGFELNIISGAKKALLNKKSLESYGFKVKYIFFSHMHRDKV